MKLNTTQEAEEKWDYVKYGERNKEWIRPEIIFKVISKERNKQASEFKENRLPMLRSIKKIIVELEGRNILKSFYFSYQRRE